jgi:hypothetical protein
MAHELAATSSSTLSAIALARSSAAGDGITTRTGSPCTATRATCRTSRNPACQVARKSVVTPDPSRVRTVCETGSM